MVKLKFDLTDGNLFKMTQFVIILGILTILTVIVFTIGLKLGLNVLLNYIDFKLVW